MIIFNCIRTFMDVEYSAVVSAPTEDVAVALLEWEIDGDTTDIQVRAIGNGHDINPTIWAEESP